MIILLSILGGVSLGAGLLFWLFCCVKPNKYDHDLKYHPEWDAWFCPTCDIWTEMQCCSELCVFCRDRPEKPSLAEPIPEEKEDGE